MEEQLITFETTKLAKEKGFDIKTKYWYDQTETLNPIRSPRGGMFYTNEGYAPTQSLLQKWLREEHGIHIICFYRASTKSYSINITHTNLTLTKYTTEFKNSHKTNFDILYDTFEEALEVGLQQALNLIL
jgi:hypothetical protein